MTPNASPATLVQLLAWRAMVSGDRTAYSYCDDPRTFGELWSDVEGFASALVEQGLRPGGRVVLALPNGHDFFTAFYGAQRAGGVAVPIFPGVPPGRVLEVARLCGAVHVVVPSDTQAETLTRWRRDAGSLHISTALDRPGSAVSLPEVQAEDVAFIQYTSGSTGDPKGVQLSHANLMTNVRQMIAGMKITAEDRFVSWLPAYHDMGLILMTIVPFFLAAPLFLLPTSLSDTRPWLDAITRHRGTFTASPDFGYRLCLRQVAGSNRAANGHDLSSLRVALNAAEPVRLSTIDSFHETFGLDRVMVAGYGLAEATVGVSMGEPSTENRIGKRGAVSVGRPFPDITVQILDDTDRVLPPDVIGHIVVKSPANTRGYFQNSGATDTLLASPGAVRTGDIGYLDGEGHLYILSRAKDVMIHAGRTVYPEEVEEIVNGISGVRYSAAIGIDDGRLEGEQIRVLVEIRPDAMPDEKARKSCVVAIARAVHDRFGFRPARVHLVAPKTIPLTHNGKLRRGELRQQYLEGRLDGAILYPLRAERSAVPR
ncbi:MAG TPA: AMP-binding protein [Acidimicrobiia bacterium]|nr:AMP-binding protein [Acidimicrobiia bacterium]